MTCRERTVARGRRHGRDVRIVIGRELRGARLQHGLTLEDVAGPARVSAAHVSRIEHGLVRALDPEELSVMYAVVGLELSVRAYPAGNPLRDAGHVALLGRLRARLHAGVRWRSEVPMPILGDLRAWDAMLTVERRDIGVEAETRPTDLQAVERRIALKLRDSGIDHAILLLADTRHNRALVRAHADALHERFPLPGKACLERLAAGTFPGGSAIVLL